MSEDDRKALPRKRRRYTMSEAARAQRRTAAWKHGGRAETALARTVPPCKRRTCPLEFPCALRREVEARGKVIERCTVALTVDPEVRRRYLDALRDGDLAGLQEMQAEALAGLTVLQRSELERLLEEGLAIEQEVFTKDGEVVGAVRKVNPRAEPFLKLNEQLGSTASQQAITPKAQGERKRDEGIGREGHAAWIAAMRSGLAADGEAGE